MHLVVLLCIVAPDLLHSSHRFDVCILGAPTHLLRVMSVGLLVCWSCKSLTINLTYLVAYLALFVGDRGLGVGLSVFSLNRYRYALNYSTRRIASFVSRLILFHF